MKKLLAKRSIVTETLPYFFNFAKYFYIFTRAQASHKFPSCFFFVQDVVSHAATPDLDLSLQIVGACDYLRYVIGSSLVALVAHHIRLPVFHSPCK